MEIFREKTMEGLSQQLVVFVKYPQPGRVKTRLGKSLGMGRAAQLYWHFVLYYLDHLGRGGYRPVIYFDPHWNEGEYQEWLGKDFQYRAQKGEDLGQRMKEAFWEEFQAGHDRVVITGSDSPDLPVEYVDEAFVKIAEKEVVLGPSLDGGYYLIAFHRQRFFPGVFQGIPWGTEAVLAATCEKLEERKVRPHLLQVWRDIDDEADWKRFRDLNPDFQIP